LALKITNDLLISLPFNQRTFSQEGICVYLGPLSAEGLKGSPPAL